MKKLRPPKTRTLNDGTTFICDCQPGVIICKCFAEQTRGGWSDWLYPTKTVARILERIKLPSKTS